LKGKKGTYILLAIVCLIWIGIAVEIVNAFSDNDESVAAVNTPILNKKIESIDKEVFSVQTVNRDPFLGTLQKKRIVKKPQKKITKPKKTIRWPRIDYKGIITDKSSKAVFLIEVNGVVQLMKKGIAQSDLILIRGDKSSVTLLYEKERKDFMLKN